jgi:hypothetical protein
MAKFDLLTTLSMNAAGFESGIDRAKKSTQGFQGMVKGIAGYLAPMLSVVAVLGVLKGSVEAIEGPGDKFAEVVAGGKEALFEFQRSIATLDFSNFFKNLKEGYNRGKEFEALLDKLRDKTAYNDYIISELNIEKGRLEEIAKDKRLELSVRSDAADKILDIAKKIKIREEYIAQKSYDIQKRIWEGKNKMEVDAAIALYEKIDGLTAGQVDSMEKYVDIYTKITKNRTEAIAQLYNASSKGEGILGVSEEQMQAYATFLTLVEHGQKDVLIKLFETSKNFNEAMANAQNEYNAMLKLNTGLIEKQEKAIDKATGAVIEFNNACREGNNLPVLTPLKSTGMPSVGSTYNSGLVGPDLAAIKAPAEQHKVSWEEALGEVENMTRNSMYSLSNLFEAQKEKELRAAGNNAAKREEIERKFQNKMKGFAVAEAYINMALSISQAWARKESPNWLKIIESAAAAAVGITQIAAINAQSFAQGGIVSSPTNALIGEYAGARSNPEIVAPLDRLKGLMTGFGGGEVVFKIQGTELVGVLNNQNRRYNSYN